eukprot:comp7998_c0_seq1/m.3508 comp7998_c0_seq1/g.3508  ORF comp7998_c0_seq1/g.3508 comp7998_c0_seq1/m.3508 type:complete len:169 (-) comp7998_c0_seq1:489-995(-)
MCKSDPPFPDTVHRRTSLQHTTSHTEMTSTSEGNSPLGSPKPARRVSWSGEVEFNEKELNFKTMDPAEVQEIQKRMRAKHTRKSISRQCLSANKRFLQVYASPPTSRANHMVASAFKEPAEEGNMLREARKMLEQEIEEEEELSEPVDLTQRNGMITQISASSNALLV